MPETFSFISAKWIVPLWEKLKKIHNDRNAELEEIGDAFGDPLVLARYYVEPKCQHHNPADYNEIEAISFVQSPVFDTINNFFNREFLIRDGRSQLFILADAGMGKTSLLMMIKLAQLTAFWPKKFNCVLLKLGQDTIAKINEIKNISNTILLLDALDEDSEGFGRVDQRLTQLLSETRNFRRVIITCRTQYFPSGDDDPFDRPGRIEVGGSVCPMFFLSLFDDTQVDEYLTKRFSKKNLAAKEKCSAIIDQMDSLRFRPLLLSHIEDILESKTEFWNEYTIYFALVRVWLLRELEKIHRLEISDTITKEDLWNACLKVAVYMQLNDQRFISEKELTILIKESPQLKHLRSFDVGGRSLLNRNSIGDYRFSHYTTQEFMISYGIVSNKMTGDDGPIRPTDQILFFINLDRSEKLNLKMLNFDHIDLTSLNLSNTDLTGCSLIKANLKNINLKNAILNKTILIDANLTNANLENASIRDSNLERAKLQNANLNNTFLDGSTLLKCNLENVTLKGASLENVNLIGANLNGVSFEEVNLAGATLLRGKFDNYNFKKANLVGANFEGAKFNMASFQKANLEKAHLLRANLENANLSNANLKEANLFEAKLLGAKIDGVNLNGANIRGTLLEKT